MAAKNHDEYCKSKHSLCTGNCHMKIDCEECKNIWNAATIAAKEKLMASNAMDTIAALRDLVEMIDNFLRFTADAQLSTIGKTKLDCAKDILQRHR